MRGWQWGLMVLAMGLSFAVGRLFPLAPAPASEKSEEPIKGWKKGKGWGWVWGKDDEVGSLNAMTPETIKAALGLVKEGKVYDLGVPYDAESFRWPGHNPGVIMTFRGPEGVRRQGDFKP